MKIKTLVKAPFMTQSGYGVQSRQIINALLKDESFEVFLESLSWGNCSYLTHDTEEKKTLLNLIKKTEMYKHNGGKDEWDLFVHITIPNEFERKGKFNVGVSAGIESDRCSHVWIQQCNIMDLIIVPSEHSRKTIEGTVVDWQNEKTGQVGSFKLEKPIVVINESVNTDIFKKYNDKDSVPESFHKLYEKLNLEPDFNFLCIGQWGKGGYKEDRKNIALTVRYFIEAFYGQKDVGLVLKTNLGKNTIIDYYSCLDRLNEIKRNFDEKMIPPIYFLHANMTDEEMAALYNHPKIKAMLSLTHGEGFGLPLIEAAACGLPIVATNWSGHLDFLKKGQFSAVDFDMVKLPDAAVWGDILVKESNWAEVKEEDAKRRMRKIVSAYSLPQEWAENLALEIKEKFNTSKIAENIATTIKQRLLKEAGDKITPIDFLKSYIDDKDDFNVLYTMPISAGDIFISTAVIDGLKKQLPEEAKIYFAIDPKYVDILEENKNIYKVIPWSQVMMSLELCEEVFDVVFTPNIDIQFTFSNWTRKGQGRLLAEQMANHCQCELGNYFIKKDETIIKVLPEKYMTIHTATGNGQWGARKYEEWQEIVDNLKKYAPELKIVQVGQKDEPNLNNVDVNLLGQTNVHQLAAVLDNSLLHLTIDSFSMHLCAYLETPFVVLFGSSNAKSTGPWIKNRQDLDFVLLEAAHRKGKCCKGCYKYECKHEKENPCINEIDSQTVFAACVKLLTKRYA